MFLRTCLVGDLESVRLGEEEVLLLDGLASLRLRGAGVTTVVDRLLPMLDGTLSPSALASCLDVSEVAVDRALKAFHRAGFVASARRERSERVGRSRVGVLGTGAWTEGLNGALRAWECNVVEIGSRWPGGPEEEVAFDLMVVVNAAKRPSANAQRNSREAPLCLYVDVSSSELVLGPLLWMGGSQVEIAVSEAGRTEGSEAVYGDRAVWVEYVAWAVVALLDTGVDRIEEDCRATVIQSGWRCL